MNDVVQNNVIVSPDRTLTNEYQFKIRKYLLSYENEKRELKEQVADGIISLADAEEEMKRIKEKEFRLKKKIVDDIHVTRNGKPRAISPGNPTSSYPNGYYYTRLSGNGQPVKRQTLEELYDYLYEYYFGSVELYSIGKVFELALSEKENSENSEKDTIRRYRVDVNRFFTPEFTACDIRTVTDTSLKEYTQGLVHRGPLTKDAFIAYKTLLNLVFRYAVRKRIITFNPVDSINNRVYLKSCDCEKPRAEDETFSAKDIHALNDEMKRREGMKRYQQSKNCLGFHSAIRFSMLAGERIGEVVALRWDDVDFQRKQVHIHAQLLEREDENGNKHYIYVSCLKNEKGVPKGGRYFPITPMIENLFQEIRQRNEVLGISPDYIFTDLEGNWLNKKQLGKYLYLMCKSVGITVTKNHGFRKTLNSKMREAGASSVDCAKLLGHSPETNERCYTFSRNEINEEMRKLLEELEAEVASEEQGTVFEEKGTVYTIPFAKRKSPRTLNS